MGCRNASTALYVIVLMLVTGSMATVAAESAKEPEVFEQMDGRPPPAPVGPFEARTRGLPPPSPVTTAFEDRNWVYGRFGATGAVVMGQERECRVAENAHDCMSAAGYARARLNTTQLSVLAGLHQPQARRRFLTDVIDEVARDPGLYVFVEDSADSGPTR